VDQTPSTRRTQNLRIAPGRPLYDGLIRAGFGGEGDTGGESVCDWDSSAWWRLQRLAARWGPHPTRDV